MTAVEIKIVLGSIVGGLLVFSAFKSLFSLGFSRVDTPHRYTDYASAGLKGRNVFKGPGKPFATTILGGLGALCLCILGIPQKFFNWIMLRFKSETDRSNKKIQKKVKTLSYVFAVLFWIAIIMLVL